MTSVHGKSFLSLWSRGIDAIKDVHEKRKAGDLWMGEAKRVQCPTPVVHGAKDVMCPQFHVDYLKENIRGSEMVINLWKRGDTISTLDMLKSLTN